MPKFAVKVRLFYENDELDHSFTTWVESESEQHIDVIHLLEELEDFTGSMIEDIQELPHE